MNPFSLFAASMSSALDAVTDSLMTVVAPVGDIVADATDLIAQPFTRVSNEDKNHLASEIRKTFKPLKTRTDPKSAAHATLLLKTKLAEENPDLLADVRDDYIFAYKTLKKNPGALRLFSPEIQKAFRDRRGIFADIPRPELAVAPVLDHALPSASPSESPHSDASTATLLSPSPLSSTPPDVSTAASLPAETLASTPPTPGAEEPKVEIVATKVEVTVAKTLTEPSKPSTPIGATRPVPAKAKKNPLPSIPEETAFIGGGINEEFAKALKAAPKEPMKEVFKEKLSSFLAHIIGIQAKELKTKALPPPLPFAAKAGFVVPTPAMKPLQTEEAVLKSLEAALAKRFHAPEFNRIIFQMNEHLPTIKELLNIALKTKTPEELNAATEKLTHQVMTIIQAENMKREKEFTERLNSHFTIDELPYIHLGLRLSGKSAMTQAMRATYGVVSNREALTHNLARGIAPKVAKLALAVLITKEFKTTSHYKTVLKIMGGSNPKIKALMKRTVSTHAQMRVDARKQLINQLHLMTTVPETLEKIVAERKIQVTPPKSFEKSPLTIRAIERTKETKEFCYIEMLPKEYQREISKAELEELRALDPALNDETL